jgi:hypothetical protein
MRGFLFSCTTLVLVALTGTARAGLDLQVKLGDGAVFRPVDALLPSDLHAGQTTISNVVFAVTHDDAAFRASADGEYQAVSLVFKGDAIDISGCESGGDDWMVGEFADKQADVTYPALIPDVDTNCMLAASNHSFPSPCSVRCATLTIASAGPMQIQAVFADDSGFDVKIHKLARKTWGAIVWPASVPDFGEVQLELDDATVGALTALTVTVNTSVELAQGTAISIKAGHDYDTDLPVNPGGASPPLDFSAMAKFASSEYPMLVSYRSLAATAVAQYSGVDPIPAGTLLTFTLFDVRNAAFFGATVRNLVTVIHPTDGGIATGYTASVAAAPGALDIVGVKLTDPFMGLKTRLEIVVSIPSSLKFGTRRTKLAGMKVRVYLPADALPVPVGPQPGFPTGLATTLSLKQTSVNAGDNYIEIEAGSDAKATDVASGTTVIGFPYGPSNTLFGPLSTAFNSSHNITVEFRRPGDEIWLSGTASLDGLEVYEERAEIAGVESTARVIGTATSLFFNVSSPRPIPQGALIDIVMPSTVDDFGYGALTGTWSVPGHGSFVAVALTDDEIETLAVATPPVNGQPGSVKIEAAARRVIRFTRTATDAALPPGTYILSVSGLVHPPTPSRAPNRYAVRFRDAAGAPISSSTDAEFPGLTAIGAFVTSPLATLSSTAALESEVALTVSFALSSAIELYEGRKVVFELTFPPGYPISSAIKDDIKDPWYQCDSSTDAETCGYFRTYADMEPQMLATFDFTGNVFTATVSRCTGPCFLQQVNTLPANSKISFYFGDMTNPAAPGSPGVVGIQVYEDLSKPPAPPALTDLAIINGGSGPALQAIESAELGFVHTYPEDATPSTATGIVVYFYTDLSLPLSDAGGTSTIINITLPEGFTVNDETDLSTNLEDGVIYYEWCYEGDCYFFSMTPDTAVCDAASRSCALELSYDTTFEQMWETEWYFTFMDITTPAAASIYDPVSVRIMASPGGGPPPVLIAEGHGEPMAFALHNLDTVVTSLETRTTGALGRFNTSFSIDAALPLNSTLVIRAPSGVSFGFAEATAARLVSLATSEVVANCTPSVPAPGSDLEGSAVACELTVGSGGGGAPAAAVPPAPPGSYAWIIDGVRNPSAAVKANGLSLFVVEAGPVLSIFATGEPGTGPQLEPGQLQACTARALDPEAGGSGAIEITFQAPVAIPADAIFRLEMPDVGNSEAVSDVGYEPEVGGCFGVAINTLTCYDSSKLLMDPDMAMPFYAVDVSLDEAKYECDDVYDGCEGVMYNPAFKEAYFYAAGATGPPPPNTASDSGQWKTYIKKKPDLAFKLASVFKLDKVPKVATPVAGFDGSLGVKTVTNNTAQTSHPVDAIIWTRKASPATGAPTVIPAGTTVVVRADKVTNPDIVGDTGVFPRFLVQSAKLKTIGVCTDLPGMELRNTPGDELQGQSHGTVTRSNFRMKTLNLEGNEFRVAEWRIDFAEDLYIDGRPITELTQLTTLSTTKGSSDTVPEITSVARGAAHLWCRAGAAPYDVVRNVPSWPCTSCPPDPNKRPPIDQNKLIEEATKKKFGSITADDIYATDEDEESYGDDGGDFFSAGTAGGGAGGAGGGGGGGGGTIGGGTGDAGYSKCEQKPPPSPPSVTVQYPPTRMLLIVPPYEEPTLGLLPAFGGSVLQGEEMLTNRLNIVMLMSAHAPPNAKEEFFTEEFFEDCSVLVPGHGEGQRFVKDVRGKQMKDGAAIKAATNITDKSGRAINVRINLKRDALDKAAGNLFDSIPPWQSTDCNYTRFVELSAEIDTVVQLMDTAVGLYQSRATRTLLASLTATEAYLTCTKLVDSLVTDSIDRREATIPDSTACFVTDTTSAAYRNDPCCNAQLSATQCCAPRDITVTYLTNAEPFYLNIEKHCNLDLYCDLANRWIPAYVADSDAMISSPATGCAAVRASLVTDELWESLRAFETTCLDRLFGPDGWSGRRCTRDTDCDTRCHYDNDWDDHGRCKVPQGPDGIRLIIRCFAENMTPLVASKLGDMWGVEVPAVVAAGTPFYARFAQEISSIDCVGPKACMFRAGFSGSGLDSTGLWSVQTKGPDTAQCTSEKWCNWDDQVHTASVCESPPGKTGAARTHFCQGCDGPFCTSLEFAGVLTEGACNANSNKYCFGYPCSDLALCSATCGDEECASEAQCLQQGNSTCTDDDVFSFDATTGDYVAAACWAPPQANPLTGFPDPCLATDWGDDIYTWPDSSGFGCLFPDLTTKATCEASSVPSVRWIYKAENETACAGSGDDAAQIEACYDDTLQAWTLHGRDECTACGRTWRSPYTWSAPEWTTFGGLDTEWRARKYESVNRLESALDLNKVKTVVDNLVDAVIGGFFKSEAKCRVSQLNVQRNILCACAAGNADCGSLCTASTTQPLGETYLNKNSAEAGKGVGAKDQARGSTINAVTSSMSSSSPNLALEKSISPANSFALCTDTARRAREVADPAERTRFEALRRPSLDTSSFNVITDGLGNVVGQLLGSGLAVATTGTGSLSVCIETSASIAQSAAYTSLGYAGADSAGYPSTVVSSSVTKSAEGALCGTLSSGGTFFPVAYDASYVPPTPTPAPAVEASQEVNVTITGTKAGFNSTLQAAFLASLASESKAPVASLSIASVTDVNDTATTRRRLSGEWGTGEVHPRLVALAAATRIRVLVVIAPTSTMTADTAATLVRATVSNPSSPLVTQYGLVPSTSTSASASVAPAGPPLSLNVTLRRAIADFDAAKQTEFAAAIATRLGIRTADVKVSAAVATTVPAKAAARRAARAAATAIPGVVRAGATDAAVIATVVISDSETAGGFTMRATFSRDMLALIANDAKDQLTVAWGLVTSADGGATALPATPTPVPVASSTPTPVIVPFDPVSTSAEFDLVKPSAGARVSVAATALAFALAAAILA